MRRLRFSARARAGTAEIAAYMGEDKPARAETFIGELEAKAQALAERPASFPQRDGIQLGLRVALHRATMLFFRDDGRTVLVVRVLSGARDLRSALDS